MKILKLFNYLIKNFQLIQIKPNYLIAYKVFVTIYTLTWLITSIVTYAISTEVQTHNWIYYLHNQIYVLLVAYYLMSTGLLIYVYYQHVRMIRVKDVINKLNAATTREITLRQMVNQWSSEAASSSSAPPKLFLLALWSLYTILVPLTYTVSLEWFINIDSHLIDHVSDTLQLLVVLNFSVINSALITFELIISLIPIRIYHFYLPTFYTCFYCLVVYLLWLSWPSSSGTLEFEAFWMNG